MRISQKKTCRRCSALTQTHGGWQVKCWLGYPQENNEYGRPLVPCPKPLTNKEYLQCEEYTAPVNDVPQTALPAVKSSG